MIFLSSVTAVMLTGMLSASAAEQVLLYTYYNDPPYSLDSKAGETTALAKWLNERSAGRYQFKAEYLPRLRLDAVMQENCENAVTAWVNPAFIDYAGGSGYIWSKAFVRDTDIIVSKINKPVDFVSINSLNGYRLGGITGRQYRDFEDNITSGKILREDTSGVEQNLLKLKLGRIDVTFMQSSSLPYYREKFQNLDDWIYIATKPRKIVERSLFSCSKNAAIMKFIDSVICDYHPGFILQAQQNKLICKSIITPR